MDLAPQNAAILLEWYRAMGVDEAIAPAPQDWYAEAPPLGGALRPLSKAAEPAIDRPLSTRKAAPRLEPALPAPGPGSTGADVMAARELARSAGDLAGLRALLETFDGCTLKQTATRLCLSRGSPNARIMLIGEAPGRDEDAKGLPFVGRAGQLLDRMLAAIGLTEEDVYITNLVFWRPPGNRTPSPEEVQVCQPFVERQIELLRPELLVFLGNAAAKQLTGASEGIMKLRGKWLSYRGIRAMATLHPAYLLRNPIAKRLAWRDLLSIREVLDKAKEDRHGRN
ncbi:MAG: uracil-DNA glycosylase [Rhodomicrobium sp.]